MSLRKAISCAFSWRCFPSRTGKVKIAYANGASVHDCEAGFVEPGRQFVACNVPVLVPANEPREAFGLIGSSLEIDDEYATTRLEHSANLCKTFRSRLAR